MKIELKKIAQIIGGKVIGKSKTMITGVAGIKEVKKGGITFLAHPKYTDEIKKTRASAVVLAKPIEKCAIPMVIVENPLYSFSRIISIFHEKPYFSKGVNPKAEIGTNVSLGKDPSIYSFVTIGDRVKIGNRVTIYPGSFIGDDSKIGDDCIIYPNVSIMARVSVGKRVIIHSGTVIGSDGYGYVQYKGKHHKIPQVGEVIIEDDVEIGSNVSIDRAALGKTIIKSGTKIDNLVQIAHNVAVGKDCIIVAQVGISGSSEIGNHVILAGQAGVVDHVKIGNNAIVGARTGVHKDVEPNQRVLGSPFMPYVQFLRAQAMIVRLPKMRDQLESQETRIDKLEKHLEQKKQKSK